MLTDLLKHQGYRVDAVSRKTPLAEQVSRERYEVVLLSIPTPDIEDCPMLESMKDLHPSLPIIVLTGALSEEKVVGLIKKGAFAYLVMPYKTQEVKATVHRALTKAS